VKFPTRRDQKVAPVTKFDKDILQLRATAALLHKQVDNLYEQANRYVHMIPNFRHNIRKKLDAQNALSRGNKNIALMHLKTRKNALALHEKRQFILETVTGIMMRLEAAETDSQIVDALTAGTLACYHSCSLQ